MINITNKDDNRSLWDQIWKDRQGRVVIFQVPNAWLTGWLVCNVISLLAPRGTVERVVWWLGAAALIVWSLLELFRGVDYFRRGLGLVVFLVTLGSMFGTGL